MYSVLRIACLQIIVLFVAHCLHEKQIKSAHRISAQAFIVCCPLPASLGQAIETTIWHNSSLNSPFICITALGCAPVPFFLLFWTIRAIFLHFFFFSFCHDSCRSSSAFGARLPDQPKSTSTPGRLTTYWPRVIQSFFLSAIASLPASVFVCLTIFSRPVSSPVSSTLVFLTGDYID